MSTEFEYLKVEVQKHANTDLYLKVPKGWRPTGRDRELLGKAATETTDSGDWDDHGWEHDLDVQGYKVCGAKEAEAYDTFDVVAALQARASVVALEAKFAVSLAAKAPAPVSHPGPDGSRA